MKTLIILGDGMADEPIEALGNKTPLQYAQTPYMDRLATLGVTGQLKTVADGFHPGSEVANMAVLGYDLPTVYEGRGVLEAASMGVELHQGEIAMRCNLVCVEGGLLKNHSAGHITTAEADQLIHTLNEQLGSERIHFYTGVSYRHLLVIKGGDKHLACTPPHDIPLQPFAPYLVRPEIPEAEETAALLNDLTLKSQEILKEHPVNRQRIQAGKDPANSIWAWSPGYRPRMQTLMERYGLKTGSVISAVDLIKGIGVYAGLKSIDVEGATGLYDTNYEGKAQAAIEALKKEDFVFLHLEASDEAGHDGDPELKVLTIRYLNDRIVRPVLNEIRTWDEDVSIAVLPDHPTPCAIRTHTAKPVPFTIYRTNGSSDSVTAFDEFSAKDGSYGLLTGREFIEVFLGGK